MRWPMKRRGNCSTVTPSAAGRSNKQQHSDLDGPRHSPAASQPCSAPCSVAPVNRGSATLLPGRLSRHCREMKLWPMKAPWPAVGSNNPAAPWETDRRLIRRRVGEGQPVPGPRRQGLAIELPQEGAQAPKIFHLLYEAAPELSPRP